MTVTDPEMADATTTARAEWVLRWPEEPEHEDELPRWGHAWVDHPHRTTPRFCGFLSLDDPLVQKAMIQSGSRVNTRDGWCELRTPLDPNSVEKL